MRIDALVSIYMSMKASTQRLTGAERAAMKMDMQALEPTWPLALCQSTQSSTVFAFVQAFTKS